MSLDATVFKHVSKVEARYGQGAFDVDECGEATPKTDPVYPPDWEPFFHVALSERIGNVAWLSFYRQRLAEHRPDGMISKIVWQRVHRTELSELDALLGEVEALKHVSELQELMDQLRRLALAAKEEGNPICYF